MNERNINKTQHTKTWELKKIKKAEIKQKRNNINTKRNMK